MKKTYSKPMVYKESFELSQHVAACTDVYKKNQAIKQGCSADRDDDNTADDNYDFIPDTGLFYQAIAQTNCTSEGDEYYCYTEATFETFLFSS